MSRYRTFVEIAAQVDTTDKELAVADFGFEDKGEFAISVPVVDDLHNRPKFRCELIQDHKFGFGHKVPPLPVAVEFCWEFCQSRMFRIA